MSAKLLSKTKLNNGLTRHLYNDGSYIDMQEQDTPYKPSDAEKNIMAKDWRNGELMSSDWIIPLTDHPQHAAYVAYRKKLRDWPSTADFPAKKPVLE